MAAGGWLSPLEVWPSHSRPKAQAALERARRQGWWCKKASPAAKPWGVITCDDPSSAGELRCSTSVLSTSGAGDGSSTAKAIDDMVRKCTHERPGVVEAERAMTDAGALIDEASASADAAEALLDAEAHEHLLEDFLLQGEEQADRAEEMFVAAMGAEADMMEARRQAQEVAADLGRSTSLGPATFVESAERLTGDASRLVRGRADRGARTLRDRCVMLRTRLEGLRRRLG